MKIFGHPVHVMIIHFPSALLPMDLVCAALALWGHWPHLVYAAFYAGAGGVILGWLAVVTGTADLVTVARKHPGALNRALVHGGINCAVLTGFTVTTFLSYKFFPALPMPSIAMIAVKGGLVALLLAGNFFGGSLVLKDKIGVKP